MKKMTLRSLSLFLSIILLFSVCGCKNQSAGDEVIYEYEYMYESQDAAQSGVVGDGGSNGGSGNGNDYQSPNASNSSNSSGSNQRPGSVNNGSSTNPSFNVSLPFTFEEYLHKSVTISFQNSASNSYGFTWNSIGMPISPVLKICKGNIFNEANAKKYDVFYKEYHTYYTEDLSSAYYVSKAIVRDLEANTEYTYQICDEDAKVFSTPTTFKTSNPQSSSFKFIHYSDSQEIGAKDSVSLGADTGIPFSKTLTASIARCPSPDFMLHTGDIVEWSKYEPYWENMIDYNKNYFSKYPVMAISGNHEASYRNGTHEIYKHFNIASGNQDTTTGFYYYFDYGNTRFIVLNTNDLSSNKLKNDQLFWLKDILSNNPKKWTVVSMHNPMYSAGSWGSNTSRNQISLALRSQLSNLFAEHKVDLVLQGHDHLYSRTHPIDKNGNPVTNNTIENYDSVAHYINPTGTIYAVHGTSGNQVRGPYSNETYYAFTKSSFANSWAEISIDNEKLTVKTYYTDNGKTILADSYGIKKQ